LDTGRDNLVNYIDGHSHCFACGFHSSGSDVKAKSMVMPSEYVRPAQGITGKYVTPEVLAYYEVLEKVNPFRKAEGIEEFIFPYYDIHKRLIGIKYRNYALERTRGDKATWWEAESQNLAFGIQKCDPTTVSTLIICEGESDTMTVKMCFSDYDVIGISGSSAFAGKLKELASWIRQYQYIYVCVDNDAAGKTAEAAAEQLLPVNRTWYTVLPANINDISDMYAMYGLEGVTQCFERAEQNSDTRLLTGAALVKQWRNYLENPDSFTGFDTKFKGLNKMIGGGLGLREVMLLVGHTGFGKSTFATNIAYNCLESTNVLWISTEMNAGQEMMRKFVECNLQSSIYQTAQGLQMLDRSGNLVDATRAIREAEAYLSGKLMFYDDEVSSFDKLLETCYDAVLSYDVGLIVIDVITDIPGMEGKEWEVAQKQMMAINYLAQGDDTDRRPPCSILMVGHTIRKDGRYAKRIQSADDIRGGGALHHKSTCVIAINGDDVVTPIRYLNLIKRPRMRNSMQSESIVQYNEPYRIYEELENVL
jgi:KaiC/GvpD/RAD55 family RecA-like ATPase